MNRTVSCTQVILLLDIQDDGINVHLIKIKFFKVNTRELRKGRDIHEKLAGKRNPQHHTMVQREREGRRRGGISTTAMLMKRERVGGR